MLQVSVGIYILAVNSSKEKHQSFMHDKESPLIFTSKTTKQKHLPSNSLRLMSIRLFFFNLSAQVQAL
jgi:hypothetical protein